MTQQKSKFSPTDVTLSVNTDEESDDKGHTTYKRRRNPISSNSSNKECDTRTSSRCEDTSSSYTNPIYKCFTRIKDRIIFSLFLTWVYEGRLYNFQDKLVFHPNKPPSSRSFTFLPSLFKLPYESGYIPATGLLFGRLHYYLIYHPSVSKKIPTILYFHGSNGNIGHRLPNVYELFYRLKCNVFLIEYRGYGQSIGGDPSEEGLYADATAAFDALTYCSRINKEKIIIFGRSLGGAVAIDLASRSGYRNKVWCVILENTFTNLPELLKKLYDWNILYFLPTYFYKNQFNSLDKVRNIVAPTLFLCGLLDKVVPPRMMKQLYESCVSTTKQFVPFAKGTHESTPFCESYIDSISQFLRTVKSSRKCYNIENLTM